MATRLVVLTKRFLPEDEHNKHPAAEYIKMRLTLDEALKLYRAALFPPEQAVWKFEIDTICNEEQLGQVYRKWENSTA